MVRAGMKAPDPLSDEGKTCQEWAKAWRVANPTAYKRIASLVDAGVMRRVRVFRQTAAGVKQLPGYEVIA